MKKQFTILLIIFSIFGLVLFSFSKKTDAQTDPGLIASWDFDQIFGNLLKENISGYDGQNYRGIWETDGHKNGAMFFNSYYDNVTNESGVVTKNLPELSNFTLLFWMKREGPADANLQNAVILAPNFYISLKNNIISILADGLANRIDVTITDNNWHHFTVIYNGSSGGLYFYKDGSMNQYVSARGDVIKAGSWRFGHGGHTAYPQNDVITAFKLDEVKLYNIILTEQQVSQEYTYNTSCTSDNWSCEDWGSCSPQGTQTRACTKLNDCPGTDTPSPSTSQTCVYIPTCTVDNWSCSDWGLCSQNGSQTRICNKTSNCQGGVSSPITSQSCTYIPACTSYSWSCDGWGSCSSNGAKTRICNKVSNCEGGVLSPATTQSCSYTPTCTENDWSCNSWNNCSSSGSQTRTCNKISNCTGGISSPAITQSCTYTPACSVDTWQCGSWGACSPQGVQTRGCSRTYDCPSAETAAPATSQYCESPYKSNYQTPSAGLDIVTNQDTIIKATVKLVCPVSATMASQGSGTIINSSGLILTNKHVIDGTPGCIVGFIDSYNDEPYFGDKQIADIYKTSSDADVAILKLRNPSNKILTSVNISQSNSSGIKLGEVLTTYGYPAKFGTKITYTSGDFSGVDGNYLKTTAVIEHGNSGGGAYLKNGTFIGIPSAVVKGSLNSMGYLLSVDKINSWINGSSYAYNSGSNNNYSRVSSIVEDIDLNNLGSLDLFIYQTEDSSSGYSVKVDYNLLNRLKGYILLQVEENGEAWYVEPKSSKGYYLKDGAIAYEALKKFGLGITNADLAKIPVGLEKRFQDTDSDGDGLANQLEEGLKTDPFKYDTDGDGVSDGDEVLKNNTNPLGSGKLYYSTLLVSQLKGRILLQVQSNGEAWYVNPKDGKRYYMKNGDAAYQIMRFLSLGITNSDLSKIPTGSL